jgi:hypothetical protein
MSERREYRFGDVIQHPILKGLFWMVIGPASHPGRDTDLMAIGVKDYSGFLASQFGAVSRIYNAGHENWIEVDVR